MAQHIGVNASQRGQGRLFVPAPIVRAVPPAAAFEVELTEEGILYRFVGMTDRRIGPSPKKYEAPSWAELS